ncbi:MAG TPA: OPT/YSL family transporter, partial [Acidobacteriaceae bacterium]|nr:OPT/YSL family transporter [Acidobacteriaceae bacterium]
ILLNAIGSSTIEDGKYLYNPATGKIEIQWIQGIGSEKAAAPQGRLMATVINGILSRKLPWTLVLLGVALVLVVELLGVRSLTFAVGAYLSIATTLAIFVGGVMRWMVDRALLQHAAKQAVANPGNIDPDTGLPVPTSVTPALDNESEISPGSLYASGLIAAGGIVGLLGVCARLVEGVSEQRGGHWKLFSFSAGNPLHHDWVSVLMFALLAFSLYYFARKPLQPPSQ